LLETRCSNRFAVRHSSNPTIANCNERRKHIWSGECECE
jgi:hypothetical protein